MFIYLISVDLHQSSPEQKYAHFEYQHTRSSRAISRSLSKRKTRSLGDSRRQFIRYLPQILSMIPHSASVIDMILAFLITGANMNHKPTSYEPSPLEMPILPVCHLE